MTDIQTEVNHLVAAVTAHARAAGATLCKDVQEAGLPLLQWLNYLKGSQTTGVADAWLTGVQAALVEVASCLSVGYVRPALFSLRAEVDMLLGWLYFKDHRVELDHVERTGKGFMLKADIYSYLSDYVPRFRERFSLLNQVRTRTEEDPYKLLSAHIHSQSRSTLPSIGGLSNTICAKSTCDEAVSLQREVTEYLNDILMAYYANEWASLPDARMLDLKKRLNAKQRKAFF